MSGIHPPTFPASSSSLGGEGSQWALHPCQTLGWVIRQDWCMVQLPSPPLWWFSFVFKCMPLLLSQGWCPWVMLTGWLVLMGLSRAEGRPRLAELLPHHSLDSRVALVPNVGLSRPSGHRQPHCTHPWTSPNSWRPGTQQQVTFSGDPLHRTSTTLRDTRLDPSTQFKILAHSIF